MEALLHVRANPAATPEQQAVLVELAHAADRDGRGQQRYTPSQRLMAGRAGHMSRTKLQRTLAMLEAAGRIRRSHVPGSHRVAVYDLAMNPESASTSGPPRGGPDDGASGPPRVGHWKKGRPRKTTPTL